MSTCHIRPHVENIGFFEGSPEVWQANFYEGGSLVELVKPRAEGLGPGGGKRGKVVAFSEKSRRRLMRALARTKADCLPVFMTLTYPDNFPGDPSTWKGHLRAWCKRLKREHPEAAGFWKLELKPRLSGDNVGKVAPHFHLLLWNLPLSWEDCSNPQMHWEYILRREDFEDGRQLIREVKWRDGQWMGTRSCNLAERGRGDIRKYPMQVVDRRWKDRKGREWRAVELWLLDGRAHLSDKLAEWKDSGGSSWGYMELKEWVSMTWFQVVGSCDRRHLKAGTRVEQVKSREGVMYYASKYVCKADASTVGAAGRFWGVHNVQLIPWAEIVNVKMSADQAQRLKRVMVRYVFASGRQRGKHIKMNSRRGAGLSCFVRDSAWWAQRWRPPP